MSFIFRGIQSGITELFSDDKEMHAPVSSRPQPRVGKLLSAKELLALEEKLDDDLSRCRATLNCRPSADTRSAAVALVHSAAPALVQLKQIQRHWPSSLAVIAHTLVLLSSVHSCLCAL